MQSNLRTSDLSQLHKFIHQAALNPHGDIEELNQHCDVSKHFGFRGLCTNTCRIPFARKRLGSSSSTKLIAVIGFPFGAIPSQLKRSEAEWAASEGAEELDIVPDFLSLNQLEEHKFAEEIFNICELGLPVRVILDISQLSKSLLSLAINGAIEAGASGIQSGNGFGKAVTISEIQEIKKISQGRCSIKAAGGVKKLDQVIDLLEEGADFLGTSLGPELMKSSKNI